jgi:hypothetical protein
MTKAYEGSKLPEQRDDLESRDIHQAFIGDLEFRDHGECQKGEGHKGFLQCASHLPDRPVQASEPITEDPRRKDRLEFFGSMKKYQFVAYGGSPVSGPSLNVKPFSVKSLMQASTTSGSYRIPRFCDISSNALSMPRDGR